MNFSDFYFTEFLYIPCYVFLLFVSTTDVLILPILISSFLTACKLFYASSIC